MRREWLVWSQEQPLVAVAVHLTHVGDDGAQWLVAQGEIKLGQRIDRV